MQRNVFAKQLMMLIRRSGMRQIELASKIGVSSAAISQFVHGITLPSPKHIQAIFEALRVPAKNRSQLQYQLMLARSEPRRSNRINSDSLFHMRSRRGLSPAQVEARTGITQDRLMELEQNEKATLTAEEKDKLAELYGVDWEKAKLISEPDGVETNPYGDLGAPQIMVSDLLDYNREEPIDKFAWQHIRNFITRPVNDVVKPVVAQAFSDEVGFRHDGLLLIVLTETPPSGYAPMELRLYEGNVFRLWQPERIPSPRDAAPCFENDGTLIWSIPVAEVILQPLKIRPR